MPKSGLPSEVMHADDVCTSEEVTALMLIIRTSFTSSSLSPVLSEENNSFTARGEKA